MSVGTMSKRTGHLAGRAVAVAAALAMGSASPAAGQAPLGTTYEGFHGATTCQRVVGWVWSPETPDATVSVDILHADSLLATVPADRRRADLVEAGIGDGRHGFVYELPESVRQAGTGEIEVRVARSPIALKRTPQSIPCPAYRRAAEARAAAAREAATEATAAGGHSKRMVAHPLPPGAVVTLDGRLDDAAWEAATFASDFLQKGPDRGYERDAGTAVAFLYDDEALYIAARMQNASPGRTRTQLVRRDDAGNLERLLVSFDTYRDRRTAYTFGITTGGVRLDYFHPVDDERKQDPSFDPVWDARTHVTADGWTAELRIPFSQLRFPGDGVSSWGLNVRRYDPATFLNMYWVVVPVYETGWASRFGELAGLEPAASGGARVEVTPYVLTGMTLEQGGSGVAEETSTRFGGDAKLGLASNLTLDVTVNPDFGQVEADPAEVNLTQFETSFAERRPFFQEGAELFQGRGPRYFYSRRIGGVPWGVRDQDLLNLQAESNIRGAAKLTGRLGSTSIGAMGALTSAATGELFLDGASQAQVAEVAPRTGFGVARVQQDLGGGSWAGLLLTGVRRDMPEDGYLASVLSREAVAGGLDWHLRFSEGAYTLSGWAGFSHVAGSSPAILRIQRSGAHYFHRPDAEHLEVDSAATAMDGYTAGITLAREAGESWLWDLGGAVESPGFEIRDAGGFDSADDLDVFANLRYRHLRPNGVFRNVNLGLFTSAGWNFGGTRTGTSTSLYGHITWMNFWRTYVTADLSLPTLSDDLNRGGPLMGTPMALSTAIGLSNSFSSPVQWSLDGELYGDDFGGWGVTGSASLTLPLSSHFLLSLTPGYSRSDDVRQFLTSIPGGGDATYGRRYIFALLERSEIYSQIRLDYSPVPDLNFEIYVEPFASSGRFHDPGEHAAARTDSLRVYGTDGTTITPGEAGSLLVQDGEEAFTLWNYDFSVRSFRSNAVVRWEWRKGSSLYLIWQQNRWAWNQLGTRVGPERLWDAVGDPGEHILTLKLSYWGGLD